MNRFQALAIGLCAAAVVACTPAPAAPNPSSNQTNIVGQARPKILTMAIQREPGGLLEDLVLVFNKAGGVSSVYPLVHDYLVRRNDQRDYDAMLAVETISVVKGTWVLNPDGTMVTTWKIHPHVTWHDGAAFTSADLLFAYTVYKDPAVPNRIGSALGLMTSAAAPDPSTFVVHWSAPYAKADAAEALIPLPKHLLEDRYRDNKPSFGDGSWLTSEFVGLGPFRLVKWEQGSHLELTRFDGYHRGRPALDTIIVRFIGDANALVANILAGSVDAIAKGLVDLDAAVELKERWAGTGNQVFLPPTDSLMEVEIQHRAEYARPRAGLTHLPVRQALYHAIDRSALADQLTSGLSPPADSWYPATHALRRDVEAAIPQFPYDPRRAQQLLAGAGWERGGDGMLAAGATGERFDLQIWSPQGVGAIFSPTRLAVADSWKAVGVQVEQYDIPTALSGDREHRGQLPGAGIWAYPLESLYTDQLHSKLIASPANRWAGKNLVGYSNPRVDTVLDKLALPIPREERIALHKLLLQEQLGDLALMPLYWRPQFILTLKGVRGVGEEALPFMWDKE